MSDWPAGVPDAHRYGGAGQPVHPVTGQVRQHDPSPPQPVIEPRLPGPYGGRGGPVRRSTRPAATRPTWRRRILRLAGLLAAVALLASVGTYTWADTKLEREVDLGKLAAGRLPARAPTI